MLSKMTFTFSLLLGLTARGQITLVPESESVPKYQRMYLEQSFDQPAINDWIESTRSASLEDSTRNWEMLIMSFQTRFDDIMNFCHNRGTRIDYQFFNLSLPIEAQRALLHFNRQQLQFAQQSISIRLVSDMNAAVDIAMRTTLTCLEDRKLDDWSLEVLAKTHPTPENIEKKNRSYVQRCLPKFQKWSQSANERAYQAVNALLTLNKSMNLLTCIKIKTPFDLQDPQMMADYKYIQHIFERTTLQQETDTGQLLNSWLKSVIPSFR